MCRWFLQHRPLTYSLLYFRCSCLPHPSDFGACVGKRKQEKKRYEGQQTGFWGQIKHLKRSPPFGILYKIDIIITVILLCVYHLYCYVLAHAALHIEVVYVPWCVGSSLCAYVSCVLSAWCGFRWIFVIIATLGLSISRKIGECYSLNVLLCYGSCLWVARSHRFKYSKIHM